MTQPQLPIAQWRQRLPIIIILLVAILGAVVLREYLSFDALRDNRAALIAFRDSNYLLTAAAFVLAYIAIVSFSLPGATAATLTGGFLFGVFPGAAFNIIAATIGAVLIFLAVRAGFGRSMAAKIDASDGRVKRMTQAIRANEFPVLFSLRLMPVLPFFVMNVIPALIGVRISVFAATTFLGIMPGGIIYTWVGAGLGDVFARDETPDLGIIFEPHILGPLLGLAALSLLPTILKSLRGKERDV
ncbi:putative membrane protein YdjX (TVP38/TMEM64 family) [Roseinatronobacter thiooxidans]|uniref:TVP38/TMEM64 family membrane protein n=1 Tax=Roseinatronobacter thiooxidans TaxID=121821 RepID=A0A2W7PVI0_9RHOB|nr:TVP38/TMEM64 family protein [Roseinatronobacter thiooxidans]PZX39503.1 putative membrane protein YdjX (TVP38/TMEM64 family) [Roseinatronobacter thiooxidans]